MTFDETYRKILQEYNKHEGGQITDLLRTEYKNRRIILTDEPFDLRNYSQNYTNRPEYPSIRPKPRGTWYSLGQEWSEWLSREMSHWWERYNHIYLLDIDYSNILRINTPEKLEKFENKYVVKTIDPNYGSMEGPNWKDISKQYKGIEIIPYQWNFRNTNWYYPWDIASGCIWDSSAIKGFREITPTLDPDYRTKYSWDD